MARRPRVFAAGLLYHVIVRGNQRRKTFQHDDDYRAYLDRLEKYRTQCQVRIYAYCLMPNHVHLLVETGSTPLAKFMQACSNPTPSILTGAIEKSAIYFKAGIKRLSATGTSTYWRWFATSISMRYEPSSPPGQNDIVTAAIGQKRGQAYQSVQT